MLGYRGHLAESGRLLRAAREQATALANRNRLAAMLTGAEIYTGRRSGIDPDTVIADADATGNSGLRSFARSMAALACVRQGRIVEAADLVASARCSAGSVTAGSG